MRTFTAHSAVCTGSLNSRVRYGRQAGFTLIETLVAISLLTIAIVAPMSLTAQSLGTAYYARDQITAFYLAQEAIEAVRAIRDAQILAIAKCTGTCSIDLFGTIPVNRAFTIDARDDTIAQCSGACVPIRTDSTSTLYGYGSPAAGWTDTNFTRTVVACYVQSDQSCTNTPSDEMRVSVTVSWQTESIHVRTFTISSNLYRWVESGEGT